MQTQASQPAAAPRERWSRGFGFTLAAVGSAVGLGNMWRFSYMAAENGGAAFVVLYVLLTLLIGLPVLLAELVIGRGSGKSPMAALVHFGGRYWRPLGAAFVAGGFVILSYYAVIAGWSVRYAVEGIFTGFPQDAGGYFNQISAGWDAVGWHLGFMALCITVIVGGVRAGIERAALVLMPLLALFIVGLAIYAATLPGAGAGYAYYFETDFSEILSFAVAKDAAGQAFFSLSLGMGAMLTYASYLAPERDLANEAGLVAGSDFGVALVSGLMVFPLLFALGLDAAIVGSAGGENEVGTIGALFVVLPEAFMQLGDAGWVLGGIFMVALSVAALTSAISLLEVVVSSAMDSLGVSRRKAALVAGTAIALLGIPSALDTDVLVFMDSLGGSFLLVMGGAALAVFVGWFMKAPALYVAAAGAAPASPARIVLLQLWLLLLRFVIPAVLLFMAYLLFKDNVIPNFKALPFL